MSCLRVQYFCNGVRFRKNVNPRPHRRPFSERRLQYQPTVPVSFFMRPSTFPNERRLFPNACQPTATASFFSRVNIDVSECMSTDRNRVVFFSRINVAIRFQTRHPSGVRGVGSASADQAKGGLRRCGEGGARPSTHFAGICRHPFIFVVAFSSWMEAFCCPSIKTRCYLYPHVPVLVLILVIISHTRTHTHTRS